MSFEARIDRFCAGHPEAPRDLILASRLMQRTARLLRAHIERALAPFELDMSQYLAICLLATDENEPSMPSELGTAIDATRTQMTRLMDGLVARGLVRRRASAQDRRNMELMLTSAGRALLERAAPAVHAAYAEAWKPLGDSGLASASRALNRLHQHLKDLEGLEP
jgi:MarR family transcriptional repressor of emrRAB